MFQEQVYSDGGGLLMTSPRIKDAGRVISPEQNIISACYIGDTISAGHSFIHSELRLVTEIC